MESEIIWSGLAMRVMPGLYEMKGLKTVISCQRAGAPVSQGHAPGPLVAEAVISRPGPQEPERGLPGPAGDNRSADRGETIASPMGQRISGWRLCC